MQSMPIIRVRQLAKSFAKQPALSDIEFEMAEGEILAVLGPNGAGKTTLINLLLGRLSADSGSARLLGLNPGDMQLKRQCGAMLQVADLPDTLKVREHIELFQSYYAAPMDYEALIDLVGLREQQEKLSKHLSGGQKQRLLFALSVCGNPRILFLDEPTVGMDVEARKNLWAAIQSLKASGTSIILTTHYLEEADFLSDRILMLNQGKVIQMGTPEFIKSRVQAQIIRFKSSVAATAFSDLSAVTQAIDKGNQVELQSTDAAITLRELFQSADLSESVTDLSVSHAALEDAFVQINQASQTETTASEQENAA